MSKNISRKTERSNMGLNGLKGNFTICIDTEKPDNITILAIIYIYLMLIIRKYLLGL